VIARDLVIVVIRKAKPYRGGAENKPENLTAD
jgi:hypothetical protein